MEIARHLRVRITEADVTRFSDGEIRVSIGENVRGKDVFLIQSTSPPVNDNLMELLVIIDTLKRASAKRITAVMPYYGYGRQGMFCVVAPSENVHRVASSKHHRLIARRYFVWHVWVMKSFAAL